MLFVPRRTNPGSPIPNNTHQTKRAREVILQRRVIIPVLERGRRLTFNVLKFHLSFFVIKKEPYHYSNRKAEVSTSACSPWRGAPAPASTLTRDRTSSNQAGSVAPLPSEENFKYK